jgi:sirohydrochlorin cobaltochelatase
MAQVTEAALLVAHGQPSDPERPERELALRAAEVEARLPGWRIGSATLAASGALAQALERLGTSPLVYPLFMTDGWFVSVNLPRRLAAAGARNPTILAPLGLDPGLTSIALERLERTCRDLSLRASETTLLVAAHGSPSDPRPRRATERFAETIRATGRFATVHSGYVDEDPRLRDGAEAARTGLCLPFFASSNSHVTEDLPEALSAAEYRGTCLPPVGEWDEIPELIATALARAARAPDRAAGEEVAR